MGNKDSADLFDEIDDIPLPSKVTSIDELSNTPAIIHIKPDYGYSVLKLEDVGPEMTSSPTERINREGSLGSILSFVKRASRKFSSTKSSVHFESSFPERPNKEIEQVGHYTRRS